MNWYKNAYDLETLTDRNDINKRISEFKQLVQILKYLVKYVFQNAPHAKKVVITIADDKKISSFPELRDKLLHAADRALDNYQDFGGICNDVADHIIREVDKLTQERRDFTETIYPKKIRESLYGKEQGTSEE